MVMFPLQRSVQVILLCFTTKSLHSKLKLNSVSHRARPPWAYTDTNGRYKQNFISESLSHKTVTLKIGTDQVCRLKPPRFGKNRYILNPNNLALYQFAKCCLIFFKNPELHISLRTLNSTGYQENLTCNSYQFK